MSVLDISNIKKLKGSNLARHLLENNDGKVTSILCLVDDQSDSAAIEFRALEEIVGIKDGLFVDTDGWEWSHAVPVSLKPLKMRVL